MPESVKFSNFHIEMGLTHLQQQRSLHSLEGELTKRILLQQGVTQGEVGSPYFFILAVELSLIKINNTKLIQGINYAINLYQERPKVPKKMCGIFKHFARISDLQCNVEKTAVIPIGGRYESWHKRQGMS